jgi:hypothetical protein
MSDTYKLDRAANALFDGRGRSFNLVARRWHEDPAANTDRGEAIAAIAAVAWLQKESGAPLRIPVGVIGPRDASPAQLAAAERIGAGLAAMGIAVVCGGRGGVMHAVCEGVQRGGGLSIGLLPEPSAEWANPHVTVALATGIGEARNALIARASLCLVAIGDSYGTLSEVALGLQFGKPVIGVEGAAHVEGVRHVATTDDALVQVARVVLDEP